MTTVFLIHRNLVVRCISGVLLLISGKPSVATGQKNAPLSIQESIPSPATTKTIPKWASGRFIAVENDGSVAPLIVTVDGRGRRQEVLFKIPESSAVNVYDYNIGPAGEIIATGSANKADGTATSYIAIISRDRLNQSVIRTWPYVALAVAVAPDGTIWAMGRLKDEGNTQIVTEPVLRRYDASGKQIDSKKVEMSEWNPIETSKMAASRDRIGWLTHHGKYLEFDLNGRELRRYEAIAEAERFASFAISESNDVVLTTLVNGSSNFYDLDRQSGKWVPAELAGGTKTSWNHALGFDGDTLITLTGGSKLNRFAPRPRK